MNQKMPIRPCTVRLVRGLLAPLMDSGTVTADEYNSIVSNLNHLAKHGPPIPAVAPKLLTPQEAAAMLAVSYSQFRALEKEHAFPFKRRMVGAKNVRYLNTDIMEYMLALSIAQ